MSNWVVRAGIATAQRLMDGYDEHKGVPGLFGFSVQYAPGNGVNELAYAGQFPNPTISCALDADLEAALVPLSDVMRLVPSPGRGFHHTFAVLYDASGINLRDLPQDAAVALSQTFRQQPNPHQVPRHRP